MSDKAQAKAMMATLAGSMMQKRPFALDFFKAALKGDVEVIRADAHLRADDVIEAHLVYTHRVKYDDMRPDRFPPSLFENHEFLAAMGFRTPKEREFKLGSSALDADGMTSLELHMVAEWPRQELR